MSAEGLDAQRDPVGGKSIAHAPFQDDIWAHTAQTPQQQSKSVVIVTVVNLSAALSLSHPARPAAP